MPHKVFIGYSLEDKLVADAACAALEAQRIPCWIAPRDILTNDDSGEAISDMLAKCHIVLLIFSSNAVDSPEVRREIDWAVSKGKIIVPLRIDDIPGSDTFKFSHGKTHWLDALTPPLEVNLNQLCDTISRLLAQQKVTETPLWTLHDTASACATTRVIVPESAKQHPVAANTISESKPAQSVNSASKQVQKPPAGLAEAQSVNIKPIPLPVYSWPAPPQPSMGEREFFHQEEMGEPVEREEESEPFQHSALEQTESSHTEQDNAEPDCTVSRPIFPTSSPPLIHAFGIKPFQSKEDDEPVAHNKFWTPSRVTFIVLFCIAAVMILFLFQRQSKQSSVKAHSVSISTLQSPVAQFLNPSQPILTPVNVQPPGLSNASSEKSKQEPQQKEVVPAVTQPALLAQQAGSTKVEKTTIPSPANQGAKSAQPIQLARGNNLTWTDSATGRMWTKKDSGDNNDLTWYAATEYCRNLQLDDHSDWRLPTIGELQGIYNASSSVAVQCCGGQSKIWHVKGKLQISGLEWSSSLGDGTQMAVYFNFSSDEQISAPIGNSDSMRALCVRKAGA